MIRVTLRFCQACDAILLAYGYNAVDHYHSICGWYAIKHTLFAEGGQQGKGPGMVSFLEQRGFLTTTEAEGGYLAVTPIGYRLLDDNGQPVHLFCAKRHLHEEDVALCNSTQIEIMADDGDV